MRVKDEDVPAGSGDRSREAREERGVCVEDDGSQVPRSEKGVTNMEWVSPVQTLQCWAGIRGIAVK